MLNAQALVLALSIGLIPLLFSTVYRRFSKATRNPFPGPTPIPIIGNILPSRRIGPALGALSKKYGPIYSLRFFFTPVLVVNSASVARDLFELRSSKYANRPLPKMAEMAGFDRGVALERDPSRLRLGRKVLHSVIQPRGMEEFRGRIQHYLALYLKRMFDTPSGFMLHASSLMASITLEMSHGYQIRGSEDMLLAEARTLVENFSHASDAGGHPVNWLPFLSKLPEWLPGMQFKARAYEWRRHYDMVAQSAYQYVESEIAKGTARPSMVYKALVGKSNEKMSKDIVMYSAAQVYTGGADTTSSTVCTFILLMVRHPDVQRKAQVEIDRVVGRDRLPTYAEREKLPYTNAVLSEVLRILPPIPARECFMTARYPEPDVFDPERWLGFDSKHVNHPLNIVFGYGRRICPGRILAEEVAFTVIALLLSLFDISNAHDTNGDPIIPPLEQTEGSIVLPLPFPCVIQPRDIGASEQAEKFYNMYYQLEESI